LSLYGKACRTSTSPPPTYLTTLLHQTQIHELLPVASWPCSCSCRVSHTLCCLCCPMRLSDVGV
jgi:hypothetical protein